ncbi:MAG: peptidylprolyl isomerase [Terriglobales bacterium]
MRSIPRLNWLAGCMAVALAGTVSAQAPSKAPAKPAAAHPSASASADPVVISAGTEQIHASQFSALLKAAPPENQAAMQANKRAVADELGKMLALVNEAHRRGLDQDPAFKAQMLLARDNALAKAVVDKLQVSSAPTDAQAKAYYDGHLSEFGQTKVKHILIGDNETQGSPSTRTQADALAKANLVEAKLKSGGDFAAVAKTDSDDPCSKDKGGELGDITPGQTVPEFETAINTLPVGQLSAPVHTRYGYHLIMVESRATMPFEKAKPAISDQLTTQAVSSAIDKIATGAHVVVSNSYFGPAKPAGPAHQ